jgi:regulator of RNase E activity RraA
MIVGDEDGVVVCPAALWDEALREVAAREALERYIRLRVASGAPLRGLYPPGSDVQDAFARWQAAGEPDDMLA